MDTTTSLTATNRCFHDAMEFLEQMIARNVQLVCNSDLTLVHGVILTSPNSSHPNHEYAHAWVEFDGQVWDAGLMEGERVYYAMPIAKYYAARRPVEVTRYDVQEALEQAVAAGHSGPWVPEYRAKCSPEQPPEEVPTHLKYQTEVMNVRAYNGLH